VNRSDTPGLSGLLPSGEPCAYARLYGSEDWHEHDHAECQDATAEADAA
jgi:hypothetical protein